MAPSRTAIHRRLLFAAIASLTAVSGCGGNSSPPTTNPTPAPALSPTAPPTAPPVPSASPFTVVQNATIATPTPAPPGQMPAPIPVPLPSANGFSGVATLPAGAGAVIPTGTTVQETLSNVAPSNVPTLQAELRVAQSMRSLNSSAPVATVAFLGLDFSNGLTLSASPSLTLNLPSALMTAATSYYLALYDPLRPALGWQLGFAGPGSVSGQSVAFTGPNSPFTFSGLVTYEFGMYAVSASAPAPTPAPSVSPNPTPTPAPFNVTPAALSFTAAGQSSTLTASDAGYFGNYFASSGNASVATVTPSSSPSGTFTVTAVAAGTTTITITESNGRTATLSITVTTTTIPVQ